MFTEARTETAMGTVVDCRAFDDREPTERCVELLNDVMQAYDEAWLIGHKGDHHAMLVDMGVDIAPSLVHVHSRLGVEAEVVLAPPEGSGSSYEGLLRAVNPDIQDYVSKVADNNRRVAVLMPFPNSEFMDIVSQANADGHFEYASSVKSSDVFAAIEDKLAFARMMDEIAAENPDLEINTIPWIQPDDPAVTFDELQAIFELQDSQGVYVQAALSGGGDGTKRVESNEELADLMSDPQWRDSVIEGRVKMTPEITDAYPANGNGCVVPTEDGEDCIVLLGAPSHKPVGISSLNGKASAGVGNDWTRPWPQEVLDQYQTVSTAIGRKLYKEHGLTGVFGPDCLVQIGSDGQMRLFVNEVNPRTQGTTPYDSMNSLKAGVPPIDLIHHIVQLGNEEHIDELRNIIGDPEEYNQRNLEVEGCFYLKIGAPSEPMEVKQDLNGAFILVEDPDPEQIGALFRLDDTSVADVVTGTLDEDTVRACAEMDQVGMTYSVIAIKAPNVGDMIGGELAPIGYIIGSGRPVFDGFTPEATPHGKRMYDTVISSMR